MSEQELELPNGWVETKLENVCLIILGQSPPSSTYNSLGEGLPFFQGKTDFGELYPETRIWCSKPQKIAEKNDLLLSVRAPVGSTNLSTGQCCIGRGLASIRPIIKKMDVKFFIYFFRLTEKELVSVGTGTVFKAITGKQIRELKIRLPPLNEQKRIVAKIEESFLKIDQIIKLLEENKNKIIIFKNAYLSVIYDKFLNLKTLDDITLSIRDGTHNPPIRTKNGLPLLSAKHIQNGFIDWGKNCPRISEFDFNKITKNNSIEENNILLTIVGTLGRSCVVKTTDHFTVQRSVAILKLKNEIVPDFVKYFFDSMQFQDNLKKNARGVAQVGVYLNSLKKFKIPIPNYDEQKIIVKSITESFLILEKYSETNKFLISSLLNIKNSILKQAFDGKLVPQDPNDEPAQILLEKIKSTKEGQSTKQRRSKNVK